MGYDVENYLDRSKSLDLSVTLHFLEQMRKVHTDLNAPCTLFICGRLLEEPDIIKSLLSLKEYDLFDLQQHTYSHQRLKTVVQNDGEKIKIFKGVSLEKIQKEVERTSLLFKEKLCVSCSGITGPYGYYRGLMDRPDILEILHRLGIRFTRTYLRNQNDWGPLPIDVQPFTYKTQGFPDILEIPSQGWQDIMFFRANDWDRDAFLNYGKDMINTIEKQDLVWSVCQHDWTSCRKDPNMDYTRAFLEYAQSKGVTVSSHKDYREVFY